MISWMNRDLSIRDLCNISIVQANMLKEHFLQEELEDSTLLFEVYADDVIIKDQKYQAVSPAEVVQQLNHPIHHQKEQLQAVFKKYKKVFDGTLSKHPTAKIDIELILGAKPIYQNPYPFSFKRRELFKRELNNMIANGVFTHIEESEWGFPRFIIPKKDGRVCWLLDFRKLNKLIVRKPFPLPKTQDILLQRGTYTYFTKIDLSMMFYCFELLAIVTMLTTNQKLLYGSKVHLFSDHKNLTFKTFSVQQILCW